MTSPTTQRFTSPLRKAWLKKTLLGLGIFLAIFGLFAYFALPGIIKTQAEKLASEKLHRQLSIERIDISPYSMALDIHGVKLLEPDGKTVFASFENLYVNLTLQSLFRLAPVIEEVRLDKPYVHLARTAPNHYNIDDLLATDPNKPAAAEPARFAVYNIQINGGHVDFDDQPAHTKHVVSELTLGIPFVSSLPSQVDVYVEPLFSAKVNNALLQLKGKARPFATTRDAVIDLNLDAVDLTGYIGYLPFQPKFKLPSAKLDMHLSASFQQPGDKPPQLVLKGTAALKSLAMTELDGKPLIKLARLAVALDNFNVLSPKLAISHIELDDPEITVVRNSDGILNLANLAPPAESGKSSDLTANKAPAANQRALQIMLGELAIHNARLSYSDAQAQQPLQAGVEKFDLDVSNVDLDLLKKTVDIAAVTSSSANFSLVHAKQISINMPVTPVVAKVKTSPDKQGPGYAVAIGKVAIEKWAARLEDRNVPQPAITTVSNIELAIQDMSTLAGKTGKVDLKAQVNQKGQLAIAGNVGTSPLHADLALDLKAVDLMPLQPYFTNEVNLLLTRAVLSTKATLKLDQTGDGTFKGSFIGDAGVSDLATVDKLSSNDFLRWKSLAFSGVNVQLMPLSVSVNQIALNDFYSRIIVDPNGRINLQDIARKDGNEQKSLTEAEPAAAPGGLTNKASATLPETSPTASPMPPIKVRKVVVKGGKVRFSDNFIKPNYTANLMDLSGSVSNLSSEATMLAAVDLHGNVNSAPLNIVGSVNPLSGNLFLDLKADVHGMELAPLSPYSGKYVGYDIEKGKLSFELAYHLENRKLEAQNRLILDQLTFGRKVDSPTATTLPVQLAITLLSDRNGVIDINLPIGGSLDDPQFSVGGIIVKVIVNLISKAITAPFALIGSMFGGSGEEMSWLEFDPGRHAVPTAGEAKLNSLAKALNDRPALKLEITGRFDPQTDREGLRRASIERKVRALKLKQLVAKGTSADMATITISPEEYPQLLDKVYKDEDFPKPRNLIGLQKDQPVAEMEKLMMENAKVSDDDLVVLGNQRAQAVKDWLVQTGQVPADRIFVVAARAGDSSDKAKSNRADFSLR